MLNFQQHPRQFDKSALFAVYNKARAGDADLDAGRVNRALGLIQAGKIKLHADGTAGGGSANTRYIVTRHGCTCPDHEYRHIECKHMIARWLLIRMQQEQRRLGRAA